LGSPMLVFGSAVQTVEACLSPKSDARRALQRLPTDSPIRVSKSASVKITLPKLWMYKPMCRASIGRSTSDPRSQRSLRG
jgi:hypothetical protein